MAETRSKNLSKPNTGPTRRAGARAKNNRERTGITGRSRNDREVADQTRAELADNPHPVPRRDPGKRAAAKERMRDRTKRPTGRRSASGRSD